MIQRKMPKYLQDTYPLFCGKHSEKVKHYLYERYVEKPANLVSVHMYLSGTLFNIVSRAEEVTEKVFNPYNAYDPIKPKREVDIDFSPAEIDSIIGKK